MRKETDSKIVTVTFSNYYEPVKTETVYKANGKVIVKTEPLLRRAMHSTGLKHQLELDGYKEIKHGN